MTDFGGALKNLAQVKNYNLVIIGVPFDEKSSYQRGAAGGPAAIRRASTGKCYNPDTELGVDLAEDSVLVDLGDVDTAGDPLRTFSSLEESITQVLSTGAVPIILGGDHSITYPAVRAVARKYQPLDLLHLDAHPDMYQELYGDRLSHACPMARILEDGLIKNLVQIGIRSTTPEIKAMTEKYKVKTIEAKDFPEKLQLEFTNPLYLSLDLDVFDPAFAPGVSHLEPGGLTSRQVLDLIHSLRARIVAFDLVELNPSHDLAGITAALAFKLLKEIAGKIVKP
ncbi:MAG: agmatinase [Acidobacteriota bacterium]|nr:agmatinase [Acidobacteriota bacterium]MDW3229520.1 agmatinase [Acidobacteriota bacterium]MDY0231517.1 agmatinase [Candidatus Saccharicenans sp.]